MVDRRGLVDLRETSSTGTRSLVVHPATRVPGPHVPDAWL